MAHGRGEERVLRGAHKERCYVTPTWKLSLISTEKWRPIGDLSVTLQRSEGNHTAFTRVLSGMICGVAYLFKCVTLAPKKVIHVSMPKGFWAFWLLCQREVFSISKMNEYNMFSLLYIYNTIYHDSHTHILFFYEYARTLHCVPQLFLFQKSIWIFN